MGAVVVINWITLDGVMQAPGRADEDTRQGFTQGGWAKPYSAPLIGAKMSEVMTTDFAWLFGHRSYDDLLRSWNSQGGPFKDSLNKTTKYVATHAGDAELRWSNSRALNGDVPRAVADLKQATDTNLVIMGSRVLIRTLMTAGLIDRYLLMIAPIVLGAGRRLFPDGVHTALRLHECVPVHTGALIARYDTQAMR